MTEKGSLTCPAAALSQCLVALLGGVAVTRPSHPAFHLDPEGGAKHCVMQRGQRCYLIFHMDSWFWDLRSGVAGQGRGFELQKKAKQQGRLERRELIWWNGFTWRRVHIWTGAVKENEIQTHCCSPERSCYGTIAQLKWWLHLCAPCLADFCK